MFMMEIILYTDRHITFTLCPVLWTQHGWYPDVLYEDDISSWTIDEMVRLRDGWEYAY